MGYGRINVDGVSVMAHRASYEAFVGVIPDGACICHACDNPLCVNPAHLFVGDNYTNQRDCVAKGRHADVRGANNPSRIYPQRLKRGAANHKSKLTANQVREIRARSAAGESFSALSRSFGIAHGNIAKVVRRINWGHVE